MTRRPLRPDRPGSGAWIERASQARALVDDRGCTDAAAGAFVITRRRRPALARRVLP
jgi:hypothetical protein